MVLDQSGGAPTILSRGVRLVAFALISAGLLALLCVVVAALAFDLLAPTGRRRAYSALASK